MTKFVLSALALTTASSLGFASSTDGEWSSLDRELANLASASATAGPGPVINAFVITSLFDTDLGGFDQTGFNVTNARVLLNADVGAGYGIHISVDAGNPAGFIAVPPPAGFGNAVLVDAFGTFKLGDQISGRMGQFPIPFNWQGSLDPNNLLFHLNGLGGYTANGAFSQTRDQGVQIHGGMQQFGWAVAVQNGGDGTVDELRFGGRVHFNAMGKGVGMVEGAYGAGDGNNLTLGAAFNDDGSLPDGAAMGFDAAWTGGQWSAHAEIADFDTSLGDNTPWSVTGSFMFMPNWEAAARMEDFDNAADSTAISGAVNYYAAGQNAKWTIEVVSNDSDAAAADGTTLGLTLTVSV